MPRKARTKSFTGMYHCIFRGNDKQDIFLDNQDRRKFLEEMRKTKEKYQYEIYAYCLMDNHVHILIRDNKNVLCKIMQSLAIAYASYFNKKYERIGHVFQNRFFSKTVENREYLLTLQRYIHQNPYDMENYIWSSYREYFDEADLVNTKFTLQMFSENEDKAKELFRKFITSRNKKSALKDMTDCEMEKEISDSQAIEVIKQATNLENILEIKDFSKIKREKYIRKIMEVEGISKTQLARILGLNRKMIQRIDVSQKGQNVQKRNVPNRTKEEVNG